MVWDYYRKKLDKISLVIAELEKKSKPAGFFRLAFFLMFIVFLFKGIFGHSYLWGGMSLCCILLYILASYYDNKLDKKIEKKKRLQDVYGKELKYLNNDFSQFQDGTEYIDSTHPFTFDLDIFGKDSFFNRINRTVTVYGKNRLAYLLSHLPADNNSYKDIIAKQKAIRELSGMSSWREAYISMPYVSCDLEKAVSDVSSVRISPLFSKKWFRLLLTGSVILFIVTTILSIMDIVVYTVPVLLFLMQLFVSIRLSSKAITAFSGLKSIYDKIAGYVSLLEHISVAQFKTELNMSVRTVLTSGDVNALKAFRGLYKIANELYSRSNVVSLILFNGLFFYDILIICRFEKWRRNFVDKIGLWTGNIAKLDAMCSFATFEFNNPETKKADIIDSNEFAYRAKGIYHPFLPGESAVPNDFEVSKGHYYIVTGANMAGKSTFLRTLGINYIMAVNGMAVCATKLEVSFFNLFTNMRTADNLSDNISYFNAELLRLEQLLHECDSHVHTFVILDEILRGTNSEDKLNGSRLFLYKMLEMKASGIIATHDLQLSGMEKDLSGRFHNYCFEIELSDQIIYSYKIKPGIAKNRNATYLLKNILNKF